MFTLFVAFLLLLIVLAIIAILAALCLINHFTVEIQGEMQGPERRSR